MDNIMRKLQSSVEVAYIKHQNFVDLLYTAFLDAQRSIYEFITCGKYAVPVWITLIGDSNDGGCAVDDDDVDNKADCQSLLYKSSSLEKNKKTCSKKNTFNNAKLKFLNDFYDVLLKFDTKDTNL